MDSQQAGERLRQAVEAGNFERAGELAEEYGAAVRHDMLFAATPGRRAALAGQARSFLEDRLHLARVMRAHIASQLRVATGAASYQPADSNASTWQIDG